MRKLPKNCPCLSCEAVDDCDEPCGKLQWLMEHDPAYEGFEIGPDGPVICEDPWDGTGMDSDDYWGDTDEEDRVINYDD